jgi:hypothetical protein
VATSIFTSFLLAALIHKAVALPTCAAFWINKIKD